MSDFFNIVSNFTTQYKKKTSKKIKLIDSFVVYSGVTGLIQLIYRLINGTFPFNSFLAGFFSCIGFLVLLGMSSFFNDFF